MKKGKEKIKLRFIVPLSVAILVLLGTFVVALYQLHKDHVNEEMHESAKGVNDLFHTELEEDAELLEAMVGFLQKDKNLQDAWLAGDRQLLLHYASPIFEEIRSRHKVTHFYFHGLDSVNFLRVHQPKRYGDHIGRFTMSQAADSGKDAWGIELGPLGTFSLRYVYPWHIDGKLAGYIELGEEIEHITQELAEITGTELIFLIDKSYLNRPAWEQGMEMLGKTGNWDKYSDVVVIDSTVADTLFEVDKIIQRRHVNEGEILFETSADKDYLGNFVPLIDAGGQDVGEIIVLKDIAPEQASFRRSLTYPIGICVVVSVLLLMFFCVYTARIGRQIKNAYKGLYIEMEEHRQTREKVQKQHKFLNVVIESLSHPFYVIDADDYTIKFSNSAAHEGTLPENTTCHMLSHHRDTPCEGANDPCPLKIIKKEKRAVVLEHVHFDKNGEPRVVEVHAYPILDDNGQVVQVIEYSLDITERKEREDKIRKAMKELERFNELSVGRELRMIELKKQINTLQAELGCDPQYNIVLEDTTVGASSETAG